MRTNTPRRLGKKAYIENGVYMFIGYWITGSNKEFDTVDEAKRYRYE